MVTLVVVLPDRRMLILSAGVELLLAPFGVLAAPKVSYCSLLIFVFWVHVGHAKRLCEGLGEEAGEKLKCLRRGRVIALSPW